VSSQILCCFPFAACRNMQTNFLADVLSSATPLSRPMMHIAKVNLAGQLEVALSGDAQDMLPKGMRRPPGLELDLDGVAAAVSGTSRTMRRRRLRQLQKSRWWWRIFHLEEATVGIGGSADVMQQSWNHSWHIAAMTHNTPELGTQTEYVNVPSSYGMVKKHNSMNNLLLELGADMLPANEQAECGIQAVPDFIDAGVYAATKSQMPAEVGVVGFSALKDAFATNAQQIKQQLAVFKEMDRDGTGRVNFEEFKDAFQRAFHAPSVAQAKFLRQFFLQLTGGQPTLDFRRFLIGLALVGGTKESASETTPETSASPDSPTSPSQSSTAAPLDFDALADRYKAQMFVQLAFAAFAANADDRIFWKEFEELWTWIHPAGLQEDGGDVKNESMSASARKAFESIGGAGVQELTFDQFNRYAEMNPGFVKRLRQAFFSRVSTELSP